MLLLAPFSSGASALAARKGNSPPCPPTLTASPHRSAAASCAPAQLSQHKGQASLAGSPAEVACTRRALGHFESPGLENPMLSNLVQHLLPPDRFLFLE